jgi:hypothetical protein
MSDLRYLSNGDTVELFQHVTAHMAAIALLPFGRGGTGYHAKQATSYMCQYNGRKYRVYSTCYGNAASLWIMVKGKKLFVN